MFKVFIPFSLKSGVHRVASDGCGPTAWTCLCIAVWSITSEMS